MHYVYNYTSIIGSRHFTNRQDCNCDIGENHWAMEPNK